MAVVPGALDRGPAYCAAVALDEDSITTASTKAGEVQFAVQEDAGDSSAPLKTLIRLRYESSQAIGLSVASAAAIAARVETGTAGGGVVED
jgi:hypothetical protein